MVLICCSAPLLNLIAKRRKPLAPLCGVRNMLVAVPLPKSKMRSPGTGVRIHHTQAEIVMAVTPLRKPVGSVA